MRRLETLLAAVILASAGLFAREGASERPPKHPEDPRVHLADILDREMFTRWKLREERKETADEKPAIDIKKILDAIDRLFDRLADLWPRSDRQAASRSTGGLLITALHTLGWVIAVALAAIISYVVYRAIQGHRARARPARILSQEEIAAALEAGEALALSGTQWLSQAHKLAAGDGLRQAYRGLYLALLSGLHAAGKINYHRSRTNWTYVSGFKGSGNHRIVFVELTEVFDKIWYGLKATGDLSLTDAEAKVLRMLKDSGHHD